MSQEHHKSYPGAILQNVERLCFTMVCLGGSVRKPPEGYSMEQSDTKKNLSTPERFAALSRVGVALMSELDEARLLHLIAETACTLTGATFGAFTLRPTDQEGQPLVPSEGNLFYLAAVVGVSEEQEALFRRMPLGGEGLLAPIFRYGVPVRVPDTLALIPHSGTLREPGRRERSTESREAARQAAFNYAHGQTTKEGLHSMGVPRGHPVVRSFLGAPLLDRNRQVMGGLLLGHIQTDQFSKEDETLLVGLAAQAAVALENARLYRATHMRAQELDAIFESIADGVTLVNSHGRILRENRSARLLRESLKDSPASELAAETLLQEPARRALNGETVQDITVNLPGDEQEMREYLVNASPLRLPATPSGPLPQINDTTSETMFSGALVVWHDVTEARRLLYERQVHAETEARRALLQLVLDELPSSVYLVRGHDARLVLDNRAARTLWGASWPHDRPMVEFLSENGIRIFSIDGRALEPSQLATLRAVQRGETVRGHQEIIRHTDGTALPVLVNAVALSGQELKGVLAGSAQSSAGTEEPAAIVVHQDVTALKEAEQLKDDFIGIAAHELRTPLAALKGFAQTLLVQSARGRGAKLSDWQLESIQDINQATLRLVELTEDLLDVTRLQAGRLTLHREPTDLVALARRVLTRLQATTEQHTLSLHSALEHFVVSIDARRIEQVLTNLIGNAMKYSPQGGPIEIAIRAEVEQHNAILSVSDCGIGIPLHQQARIFGRFERAENARAYGISGTGLGLYLCRELVERHGGRIWFASAEGQGSTFSIALPGI